MVRSLFAILLIAAAAVGTAACSSTDDGARGNEGSTGNNNTGATNPGGGIPGTGGAQNPAGGNNPTGGGVTSSGNGAGGVSSSAGASVVGGNGAGGTGMPLCGGPAIPANKGRCMTGKVVAKGSALMIHDFEEPGEKNDYMGIFFGDGRAGTWADLHDTAAAATVTMAAEATTGGPPGNTRAIHYKGSAPGGWGATLAATIANCYDASIYKGISFYIKGNPAAGNSQIKFSMHSPISEPAPSGGCSMEDSAAGKCYDHFASVVNLTDQWQRVSLKWADLKQNCASDPAYVPQAEILTLSFSILAPTAGFDFWVDNLSFDTGDLPSNGFAEIVPKAMFEEMWMTTVGGNPVNQRNAFYTYEGLVAAIAKYPAFATTGTPEQRRREVASFMSNVAHETDSLALIEETMCASDMVQSCKTSYGSAPNGMSYHGRGPIQLTHTYNYTDAANELGISSILSNPEVVATDATIAWSTGLWFWMTDQSGKGVCHAQYNSGLGATINIINGIECNNGNPGAVANRIKHYRRFCQMLGIDPGPNQGC
jgi:predicted chitinase